MCIRFTIPARAAWSSSFPSCTKRRNRRSDRWKTTNLKFVKRCLINTWRKKTLLCECWNHQTTSRKHTMLSLYNIQRNTCQPA
jgi:hypothetical protein